MRQLLFYSICVLLSIQLLSCKSYAPVPIDEKPLIKIDKRLLGIWKMQEDTDKHNYFVIETLDSYRYNMSYMNRGGENRWLEHWPGFISDINKEKFLNITYRNSSQSGYIFLKLVQIQEGGFSMKAQLVKYSTLNDITMSWHLKQWITRNLDNPAFYGDTLHFRRLFALEQILPKK